LINNIIRFLLYNTKESDKIYQKPFGTLSINMWATNQKVSK